MRVGHRPSARRGPPPGGTVGRVIRRLPVRRFTADRVDRRVDTVAVEEPLEMRTGGDQMLITMRTPGADIDLAHGYLLTEGVISAPEHVRTIRYCAGAGDDGRNSYNVLEIDLDPAVRAVPRTRSGPMHASCGVCGTDSLDQLHRTSAFPPAGAPTTVPVEVLRTLPGALRERQRVFDSTGGLHGAGLFRADGTLLAVREDVGRHNAVDKVLGWALTAGLLPLTDAVLMLSGRASFELVQKAGMAGIPVVAAVSAPSSLAVELAEQSGITLAGFVRGDRMNVYSHPDRILG